MMKPQVLMTICLAMGAIFALAAPIRAQGAAGSRGDVVLVDPVDTNKKGPERRRPGQDGGGYITGFLFPGFGFPRQRPLVFGLDEDDFGGANKDRVQDGFPGNLGPDLFSSLLGSIFGGGFPVYPEPSDKKKSSDTDEIFLDYAPGPFGPFADKDDEDKNATTTSGNGGCGLICLLSPALNFPSFNFGGFGQSFPEGAEPDVVYKEKVLPDGTVVRTNKTSYSSDDGSFHVVFHTTSVKKEGSTDGEDNELDDDKDSGPGVVGVTTKVEGAVSGSAPNKEVDEDKQPLEVSLKGEEKEKEKPETTPKPIVLGDDKDVEHEVVITRAKRQVQSAPPLSVLEVKGTRGQQGERESWSPEFNEIVRLYGDEDIVVSSRREKVGLAPSSRGSATYEGDTKVNDILLQNIARGGLYLPNPDAEWIWPDSMFGNLVVPNL